MRLRYLCGIVAAFLVTDRVTAAEFGNSRLDTWVRLVVLWTGVGRRQGSFMVLGRYVTSTVRTTADQPVVSRGSHRVIRHPGYVAVIIACAGIGAVNGNWLSVAGLLCGVTTGRVYRTVIEERALLTGLGGRNQDYASHTKRLIPFVW